MKPDDEKLAAEAEGEMKLRWLDFISTSLRLLMALCAGGVSVAHPLEVD